MFYHGIKFLSLVLFLLVQVVTLYAEEPGDHLVRVPEKQSPKQGLVPEDFFSDPKVLELCQAIDQNDCGQVEVLLDEGVDVNYRGVENVTPLMWAIVDFTTIDEKIIELMLKAGADPNLLLDSTYDHNSKGQRLLGGFPRFSAIHVLVSQDNTYWDDDPLRRLQFLQMVLKYGGDPNLRDSTGYKNAYPPLRHVTERCNEGIADDLAQILLDAGADVNIKFEDGIPILGPRLIFLKHGLDFNGVKMFRQIEHLALKRSWFVGRFKVLCNENLRFEGEYVSQFIKDQHKAALDFLKIEQWFKEKKGIDLKDVEADFLNWCREIKDLSWEEQWERYELRYGQKIGIPLYREELAKLGHSPKEIEKIAQEYRSNMTDSGINAEMYLRSSEYHYSHPLYLRLSEKKEY